MSTNIYAQTKHVAVKLTGVVSLTFYRLTCCHSLENANIRINTKYCSAGHFIYYSLCMTITLKWMSPENMPLVHCNVLYASLSGNKSFLQLLLNKEHHHDTGCHRGCSIMASKYQLLPLQLSSFSCFCHYLMCCNLGWINWTENKVKIFFYPPSFVADKEALKSFFCAGSVCSAVRLSDSVSLSWGLLSSVCAVFLLKTWECK